MSLYVSGAFPTFLYWTTSGEAIFMIMLGGITVFLGPLAGTAIFLVLNDRITNITEHHGLVMGSILLVLVLGLRKGLLDYVVAPDRLDDEVARLANQLAGYGPQALRQQKRMLRAWEKQPIDAAIEDSVQEFANAFKTGEPQAYMAGFGGKH